MKVLLLTSEMNNAFTPTGGAFNLPRLMSLVKIGAEVRIINPVGLNAPIKSILESLNMQSTISFFKKIKEIPKRKRIDEFNVCYKPWVHLPKRQFWYREVDILHLFLGTTIMNVVEDFRPDIILTSWLHPFGTYAKYTKRRFNAPVVAIAEGSDLLVFPKKYRGIERIYLDYVKYVDHLIYVSEAQKRDSFPYFPFNRSTVIYNGYDEELFRFEKPASKKKKGKIQIISVGGLSYSKGHDILLRAMTKLSERFHLLLVGDGPDRIKYEKIIKDEALQKRVKIIGEVQHSTVKDLLLESDVYCQPSRSESFGIAVLEAMACGLPVVASRVGGLPELIIEGFSGYLFEPGNEDDVAHKIEIAVKNKWDNEGIANWAKRNWEWKKWAASISKVFDEVLTHYQ